MDSTTTSCEKATGPDIVDVGTGILGRLGHRERVARVLPPVGEEDEAVGLARRGRGERELQRLRQVGAPARHAHLGPLQLVGGAQRLIHHGLLPEDDEPGLVPLLHGGGGGSGKAIGLLAGGEAHAVRDIQEEEHVQLVHPPWDDGPCQRHEQDGHEHAAQAESPAVPDAVREAEPARLAAPVEDASPRTAGGPAARNGHSSHDGHRASPAHARRRPHRLRVRSDFGVHQIDGDPRLPRVVSGRRPPSVSVKLARPRDLRWLPA